MLLVCPSCDAKFKIPDGAIPAGGRTVRCANCKNSWHAAAADIVRKQAAPPRAVPKAAPIPKPAPVRAEPKPVPFDGTLDDQTAADAAALRRSVRGTLGADEPKQAVRPDDALFDEGAPARTLDDDAAASDDFGLTAALKKSLGDDFAESAPGEGDDESVDVEDADPEDFGDEEEYDEDDFLVRRRADQRRQNERESVGRMRKILTIGWSLLVVFFLAIFYVFIFEEENMRVHFPGTSEFVYGIFEGADGRDRYRPEEGETLTKSPALAEEYVRALLISTSIETRSGQQGLMLRGFIENAGTTGANVPKVRAIILDARGNELDSWTFNPIGLILRRGGKIQFEEFRTPIPPGANKAEVKVLEGTKSTPAEAGS